MSRIGIGLVLICLSSACAASPVSKAAAPTLVSSVRPKAFAIPKTDSAYNESALNSALRNAMDQGLPGVVVHIRSANGEYSTALGTSNTQTGAPMRIDNQFRLSGNSKAFLALAAADMHSEGLLNLDSPISEHLPKEVVERITNVKQVTLRQLLNHTSGIADYMNDHFLLANREEKSRHWSAEEVLSFAYDLSADFAPGTSWTMSNTNYVLAEMVVSRIAGQPIHQVISSRVLEPLGLTDTADAFQLKKESQLAHGYVASRNELIDVTKTNLGGRIRAGSMVSTAKDLSRFIQSIGEVSELGPSTEANRAEMFRALVPTGPGGYGLGIQVFEIGEKGELAIGHGGSAAGYRSEMFYIPSQGISVAILANRSIIAGSGKVGEQSADVFDEMVIDLLVALLEKPETDKPASQKKLTGLRTSFSF